MSRQRNIQTTTAVPEIAVFSLKVERDKLDRFKVIAADNQRSVAAQLRWFIDRALEDAGANGEAA